MTRFAIIGMPVAAALLVGIVSTPAQTPTGRAIYQQTCASCHGVNAEGTAQFPRLAHLPTQYLKRQLNEFRTNQRKSAIMESVAHNLSAQEISALTKYLSGLKASQAAPVKAITKKASESGALIVTMGEPSKDIPACVDCHGFSLQGGGPEIPPLMAQNASYLLAQLQAYKADKRSGGPLGLMGRVAKGLDEAQMSAVTAYIASLKPGERVEIPRPKTSHWQPRAQNPDRFAPPPVTALPAQPQERRMVLLGERIFAQTPKYAAKYVGNQMSCRNCHLTLGRDAASAPMWAAVPQYPKYRGKNKRVNTFIMRTQGCFRYSEDGKPPPASSDVMVALITYMHWMASGLPVGIKPEASGYPKLAAPGKAPSRERGKAVYASDCALCHGPSGQGHVVDGSRVFPPLWGALSYNWGAGMHRVNTAAAFIHANMPLGARRTLSIQAAWDVAAWINSHPRPQDPRYNGNLEQTRERYHRNHAYDYYGRNVDGFVLGAPGTLKKWERTQHPNQ